MKRDCWGARSRLHWLCLAVVPLGLAGPVLAKPVLTVLGANTTVSAINDSGVVTGTTAQSYTVGFVRTPDGTITTFQVANAIATLPQAINAAGVIAGHYVVQGPLYHGFLRTADGTITTVDAPGGSEGTYVLGINSQGLITGDYDDQAGFRHAFIRAVDGTFTTIDGPNGGYTEATDINDAGEVVGDWRDTAGIQHGFVRSATGVFKSFDASAGARVTWALDINGKGAVTGDFIENNVLHCYVRQPGGALTTFDAGNASVTGINDAGTIAGSGDPDNKGYFQGFVRRRTGTLRTFGWHSSDATTARINNQGVVVGYFQTFSHKRTVDYGFIWTP